MNWIKIDHQRLEETPIGKHAVCIDELESLYLGKFVINKAAFDGYKTKCLQIEEGTKKVNILVGRFTHYAIVEEPKTWLKYNSLKDLNCEEFKTKIYIKELLSLSFSEETSINEIDLEHRYFDGTYFLRFIDEYNDDYADVFSCKCDFEDIKIKLLDWANDEISND